MSKWEVSTINGWIDIDFDVMRVNKTGTRENEARISRVVVMERRDRKVRWRRLETPPPKGWVRLFWGPLHLTPAGSGVGVVWHLGSFAVKIWRYKTL